jgi:hypothetical protein
MRTLLLLIAATTLVVAACGSESTPEGASGTPVASPSTTSVAPAPPTSAPPSVSTTAISYPATSLAVLPTVEGSAPAGPVFVDEYERCPESETSLDFGDGGAMSTEASRLEPMLGRVLAYGTEHADEFGTYGLMWHDATDASVFISLTTDLDAHRAALADIAEYPDELIVCQAALSGTANQALQAALVADLAGRFTSIGQGYGWVEIHLLAHEEQLAAELAGRFGDIVSLKVGNFDYPLSPTARAGGACSLDVTGPTDLDGLTATLEFDQPSVGADDELSGTVTVTNTGAAPASFSSGSPLVASIVRPGTTTVVAAYAGMTALLGDGATLQPGESHTISVVGGFASCDPGLGYTLPPGQYDAVVPVVVAHPQQAGDPTVNLLVASAPIIIAP